VLLISPTSAKKCGILADDLTCIVILYFSLRINKQLTFQLYWEINN
jgi:hypothetical protein